MFLERLPISNEKYKDVIHLSQFCNRKEAREYLKKLPHSDIAKKGKKTANTQAQIL